MVVIKVKKNSVSKPHGGVGEGGVLGILNDGMIEWEKKKQSPKKSLDQKLTLDR